MVPPYINDNSGGIGYENILAEVEVVEVQLLVFHQERCYNGYGRKKKPQGGERRSATHHI